MCLSVLHGTKNIPDIGCITFPFFNITTRDTLTMVVLPPVKLAL